MDEKERAKLLKERELCKLVTFSYRYSPIVRDPTPLERVYLYRLEEIDNLLKER